MTTATARPRGRRSPSAVALADAIAAAALIQAGCYHARAAALDAGQALALSAGTRSETRRLLLATRTRDRAEDIRRYLTEALAALDTIGTYTGGK